MKAARLYAYDEHMQVDLTLEMVPIPLLPMRPLPDEHNSPKACNDVDSCPAL
jgi:hypothetical protein